jgi:RNA polymerase sigma-70 factor, ECF subfamily
MAQVDTKFDLSKQASAESSDEQLLLAYRKTEDRRFFETLVRRYERELYTFLRRFLGDAQLAEDTFQSTFLSVHLRLDQFEEGKRFRPWVYAIATNKAIDCQRRNRRHRLQSLDASFGEKDSLADSLGKRIEDDCVSPADAAIFEESGARVRNVVTQLPPATQQLIQLAFYQGLKYADIGEILGIPIGTVKSRVHTAMRKLSEIWLRMYPEDVPKSNSDQ